MDSLSTDITVLTIGGEEKTACRTGEAQVTLPNGDNPWHGLFSWSFAQALLNTPSDSNWIRVLAEMESLIEAQGWEQPLLFHGQPTQQFGLFD